MLHTLQRRALTAAVAAARFASEEIPPVVYAHSKHGRDANYNVKVKDDRVALQKTPQPFASNLTGLIMTEKEIEERRAKMEPREDIPPLNTFAHGETPHLDWEEHVMTENERAVFGGHKGSEDWKLESHPHDTPYQLEPDTKSRVFKDVWQNRFVRWFLRNAPTHKPFSTITDTEWDVLWTKASMEVGRRHEGAYGIGFDLEDVLELMHDPSLFPHDTWIEFGEFIKYMQPLLDYQFAPQRAFMPPAMLLAKDQSSDLTRWQELEGDFMKSWRQHLKRIAEAKQIAALHCSNPVMWPYTRLAATFGRTVTEIKEYIIIGGGELASSTGVPFEYAAREEQLHRRTKEELREFRMPFDWFGQYMKAGGKWAKWKEANKSLRYYFDMKFTPNVFRNIYKSEPSIEDIQTKTIPFGAEPDHVQEADLVRPRTKTPEEAAEALHSMRINESNHYNVSKYFDEASNYLFLEWLDGTYGGRYTHPIKPLRNLRCVVRQRDGTLRHATVQERVYGGRFKQRLIPDPLARYTEQEVVTRHLNWMEDMDPTAKIDTGSMSFANSINTRIIREQDSRGGEYPWFCYSAIPPSVYTKR